MFDQNAVQLKRAGTPGPGTDAPFVFQRWATETRPRGGGRELEAITHFVLGAEQGYLSRPAWKVPKHETLNLNEEMRLTRQAIMDALEAIDRSPCRLFNPLNAVRWNSDKSYLFDLAAWGIPIVPTQLISPGDAPAAEERAIRAGWTRVVLKPMVGAGAADVRLVPAAAITETLAELATTHTRQSFLLQPLVESVLSEGEWSFIFIDGAFSHALLKRPAPGDFRAHGIYDGTVIPARPSRDDLAQAEAIAAVLPFDLLYARLDLVRVEERLAVMELELIEPMLYFDLAPASAGQLVKATLSRVRGIHG